jgi:hypothetical protein
MVNVRKKYKTEEIGSYYFESLCFWDATRLNYNVNFQRKANPNKQFPIFEILFSLHSENRYKVFVDNGFMTFPN